MGSFPSSSHTKRLLKIISTASLVGAGHLERLWRTSRQVRLWRPWAKPLTGRPHLYVEDRWPRHLGNPKRVRTYHPKHSDTIRFLVNGG